MTMIPFEEFKKLDLRVARILSVENHPNADKLYVLTIDTGDEQKKIVAGIRAHYKPEELTNRLIVLANNIEPATIRGVQSNGMLLAATDGGTLSILTPLKDVKPGSTIK